MHIWGLTYGVKSHLDTMSFFLYSYLIMSRPLRIEFPGAWYHLMNRGRRGEIIFTAQEDRQTFLALLQEAAILWNVKIAAYCLMDNHYHLLAQTPQGNLSRFMRHLNGVYTQRYNRLHGYDGQLFRGRYKSILVEEDSYLLELLRYIHRNPLRAKIVDNLDKYRWSSHQGYLSSAKQWHWLYKDFILGMLTEGRSKKQRLAYRAFMGQEDNDDILALFQRKQWPVFLGGEKFVAWVKASFYQHKHDRQVPESLQLAPEFGQIIREVCRFYNTSEDALLTTRRGRTNVPRDVAIYLCRELRNDTLKKIGMDFGMTGYSPAGNAVNRIKNSILKNKEIIQEIDDIKNRLYNCNP